MDGHKEFDFEIVLAPKGLTVTQRYEFILERVRAMKLFRKTKEIISIGAFLFLGSCERSQQIDQNSQKSLNHPLDDRENVEVYTFIVDFLKKQAQEYPQEEVEKWYDHAKKSMHDQSLKPHIACMVEGEIAGLLRLLLLKDPRYENITLYGKDGVGLATSGMKHRDLHFEERPHELNLGFMTASIVSGPKTYTYSHDKTAYREYILSIYQTPDGFYTVRSHKETKGDVLIGYVSYIAHQPQSPLENPPHGR